MPQCHSFDDFPSCNSKLIPATLVLSGDKGNASEVDKVPDIHTEFWDRLVNGEDAKLEPTTSTTLRDTGLISVVTLVGVHRTVGRSDTDKLSRERDRRKIIGRKAVPE
jgi:hypothetical protein